MDGQDRETATDVEKELQSTREDLDQTLREIEIRLRPSHIAEETRQYAAGKLHAARDAALRHPLLALIGTVAASYLVALLTRRRLARRYAWPAA